MRRTKSLFPILSLLLFYMLFNTPHAQLGEFAGHIVFNVTLGQSETLDQWTIFNSGNSPVTYNVIAPSITINKVAGLSANNRTAPIMIITPSTGTLQPRQNQVLNITVYMPAKNNTGGLSWEAIPQIVTVTNNTNPGGAVVQVGVAKIISINAVNPEPDYALYAFTAVIIIIIIGGALYMKNRVPKPSRRAARAVARGTGRASASSSRAGKVAVRKKAQHAKKATKHTAKAASRTAVKTTSRTSAKKRRGTRKGSVQSSRRRSAAGRQNR